MKAVKVVVTMTQQITTSEFRQHTKKARALLETMYSGKSPVTTLRRIRDLGEKTCSNVMDTAPASTRDFYYVAVSDKGKPVKRQGEYVITNQLTPASIYRKGLGSYDDDTATYVFDYEIVDDEVMEVEEEEEDE